ncbi:rhomboid family intramembrane serine protease [Alloscardovia criceti]|uniref:rhomboid family intramembrane serine protease n=1 Tax=Alloscardovia criceti TaxID=356828 RepID=UPI0014613B66|nr:rhomboid family intramembrane serine protease [Alloscardovia criceti]
MTNPFTRGDSGPAGPWDPRNPNRTQTDLKENWQRFSRRWRNNWRMNGENITQVLVVINVVIFIVQQILQLIPGATLVFNAKFALIPALAYSNPWMLITSGFLHTGIIHLLMNMLTLYFVGKQMEKLLGHWAFLGMYLVSMLGGSVLFALWPGNLASAAMGASGAIYGLFAAMMTVYNRIGVQTRGMMFFLFVMLFLPIFMGNVAWQAHLGGFIAGGVLSLLMMHGFVGLRSASINKRMAVYGSGMAVLLVLAWLVPLMVG